MAIIKKQTRRRIKAEDCQTLYTVCFTNEAMDAVETYQAFVKKREKKMTFNKSQAVNRIIKEWSEDRHLTLEVTRK